MIYANGLPKSGTHLLCAFLEQNGLRRYQQETYKAYGAQPRMPGARQGFYTHSHIWSGHIMDGRVFTVFRHPRDVLVSYSRWGKRKPIESALNRYLGGVPFVDAYYKFLPWKATGEWFEFDWLLQACEVRAGVTWSGELSDWSSVWTDRIDEAYRRAGGLQLEVDAGYSGASLIED